MASKRTLLFLVPLLMGVGAMQGQAQESRQPCLALHQKAAKAGGAGLLDPYLSFQAKSGKLGAAFIYHVAPTFDQLGNPTTAPSEIVTDLTKDLPVVFHHKRMWIVFLPTPDSEMKVLIHGKSKGEATKVARFEITSDKKGEAHFSNVGSDGDWAKLDSGLIADQTIGGGGPNAFKNLVLGLIH